LLSRRVATGRGRTQAEADRLAVAEAAERYSIQYSPTLPAQLPPFVTIGGTADPVATADLTLGAPGRSNGTAGAAAGETPEDALRRAALEMLEHLHLARLRSGSGELASVDPAAEPGIAPHVAWLAGQFRRLEIRARAFAPGYVVAVVACTDLDGGRRTEGSAARLGRAGAVLAAAEEAIFHWRNMVELERAAPDLGAMSPDDRARIARYRGALPREPWPASAAAEPGEAAGADVEGLLAAVAVVSGRRVRAFDLTAPEVGVPVVRLHLG
jgi:ribosomal protein S12 methylthiotransferase accessory factor YcaO